MAQFVHHDLRLLNPSFDSPLLDVLTDLEHLRRLQLQSTTPWPVFLQLQQVFQLLESLASARIEGNHTTLADCVEARIADSSPHGEPLREIHNIEQAKQQVEEAVQPGEPLTEHLLRGLHVTTVAGLEREGDRSPGAYLSGPVRRAQAMHLPPHAMQVPGYMADIRYDTMQAKALMPEVVDARQSQIITAQEGAVLAATIKAGAVKSGDLESVLPGLDANQRTSQLRQLVDSGMLQSIQPGARQYSIGFCHNMLLRGV